MTSPRDSLTRPTVALALAALLLAPTTVAQGAAQDDRGPSQQYEDLTEALEAGETDRAASIYQQHFRGPASNATPVQDGVEAALQTAQETEPGTDRHQAAVETVSKGLLAVAFHAVQAAGQQRAPEQAQAYFDVIATGLSDEASITDLEAAFANATTEDLPGLVDRLNATFVDLMLAETYHEVVETGELARGQQTSQAAKEAGEAAGYALGIRQDVADELGPDLAGELDSELAELVQMTSDGRGEAAGQEAEEILALLAEYGLQRAPVEKVDALERFEEALEEEAFDEAEQIYQESFRGEAQEYAGSADRRIQEAFQAARQASASNDEAELAVQTEVLEKTILDIAWTVGFHELAEGEVHEGLEWLAPLLETFGWYEDDSAAPLVIGRMVASQQAPSARVEQVQRGLGENLTDKVREEVEETFINWNDTATSRAKAAEALLYARPAKAWLEGQLGSAPTDELFDELHVLINATDARERDTARTAGDEVLKVLDQLAAGEGASELEQLVVELEDKIAFVAEEYRGYYDAREEGDTDEAQTELGEARAFTNATIQLAQDRKATLAEANGTAHEELVDRLDRIDELLADGAALSEVTDEVNATLELLDAFRRADAPTVELRIGPLEQATQGAWVPVQLVGAPTEGFSIQAEIGYDADAISVEEVEIPPQVGASTTSEGTVRFNAASTGGVEDPATVARLHVVPIGGATEVSFSIDVTTLTDAEGQPLSLGDVTGTTVDLSDLADQGAGASGGQTNGTGAQPAPGAGVVAVLAVAGLAAWLHARRRKA